MVAWVVLDRRHYRQAGPFALPLSTPPFPLPHLTPLLPYSYGHSYTTATHQPLCNQSLTHSFAHFCTHQKLNSFIFNRFRTLCEKHGGWGKGCNGVKIEIGKWKAEEREAPRSRWEGMGRTYCRPAGTRMASFISVFAFLHESRSP